MALSMKAVRDRRLLIAAGFLRAMTTSIVGIALGVHLGRLGIRGHELGVIVSSGLSGAALAAVVATFAADRIGRRRFLIVLSIFGVVGTVAFASTTNPLLLAGAAFLGMLNGMGKDRGAAVIVEQAAIPGTTDDAGRTRAIAIYTMLQDIGHAVGALAVAAPAWLAAESVVYRHEATHRDTFLTCAAMTLAGLVLYSALGRTIEPAVKSIELGFSRASRKIVGRIAALFAIDSLAGGFLTTAMISYFFFERFGVDEGSIGVLFFFVRVLNAVSHLAAVWMAKRIGLVNTIVFTQIPSNLLLIAVGYAPNFALASVLFLLRESLAQMDVPTRQSYLVAVVREEERTRATGIANLVRLSAWAIAPAFAGHLMRGDLHLPLVIGSTMKIVYDLLLYLSFRGVRPPEEGGVKR